MIKYNKFYQIFENGANAPLHTGVVIPRHQKSRSKALKLSRTLLEMLVIVYLKRRERLEQERL